MKWPSVSAVVAMICLGAPSQVFADAIAITSGNVFTYWDGSPSGWRLLGDNTSLHGENFGGSPEFDSGMLVDLSRTIFIDQELCCPGQQTVRGTTFYPTFLRGSMSFSAPPFTAPTAPQNTFRFFDAPFTMLGHINGFATPDFSGPPEFSVDITGGGTSSLGPMRAITTENGTAWINWSGGLGFTFAAEQPDPPSPTPEPASLILLASGLVVAAIRRR